MLVSGLGIIKSLCNPMPYPWETNGLACAWGGTFGYDKYTTIGVAPAPDVSVWTTPPANGEDAQQTVNGLLDEQLGNQQTVNAGNVVSSWWDKWVGGTVSGISTPMIGGLLIIGVVGLVMITGDSGPRRYGR